MRHVPAVAEVVSIVTPVGSPFGLYVHIPFCRVRCSYCAFAITTEASGQAKYVEAVVRELGTRVPSNAAVDTIYLGGGTPSRLDDALIASMLEAINERIAIEPNAEITLEANPEDVSAARTRAWRAMGVNRLSIGAQSTSETELRRSGRLHGAARALAAIADARSADLRVSADLMIGLPGQSRASFQESLGRILDAGPGHLSTYLLDLEEGTALERSVSAGRTVLAEDDEMADSYAWLIETASQAGLAQYEISNFAREGEQSRHNLRYWEGRPWIGLGNGAHSFDGRVRSANVRDPRAYIEKISREGSAEDSREEIDEDVARRERMFLSLRQTRGLDRESFESLAGAAGEEWRARGVREGWLQDGPRVAFTTRGFLLSNGLIAELF